MNRFSRDWRKALVNVALSALLQACFVLWRQIPLFLPTQTLFRRNVASRWWRVEALSGKSEKQKTRREKADKKIQRVKQELPSAHWPLLLFLQLTWRSHIQNTHMLHLHTHINPHTHTHTPVKDKAVHSFTHSCAHRLVSTVLLNSLLCEYYATCCCKSTELLHFTAEHLWYWGVNKDHYFTSPIQNL